MFQRPDGLQDHGGPIHGVEVNVLRENVDAVDEDGQLGLDYRGEGLEGVGLGGRNEGHALADVVFEGLPQFNFKD